MKTVDTIFHVNKNSKKKSDFIFKGINVSQIYRRNSENMLLDMSDLVKEGEFCFNPDTQNNYGAFAHYYKISDSEGIKVPYDSKFANSGIHTLQSLNRAFNLVKQEYINHLTGLEIGANLPKNPECILAYEKTTSIYYPVLKMEDLGLIEVGSGLLPYFERQKSKFKFREHVKEILPFLSNSNTVEVEDLATYDSEGYKINRFLGADICHSNSRWFEEEARVIDSAKWKFKGVHDLK